MFTGIIQHLGRVIAAEPASTSRTLIIDPQRWSHAVKPGDSIAVDGCCLTVTDRSTPERWTFDVVTQTLQATNLGELVEGDPVNLEHPLTPQSFLDGHIVQGHIDGVGVVDAVHESAADVRLRITVPAALTQYIVERGSIAVNGVSLTIASAGRDWLDVALIPTTLHLTNLGALQKGSRVNLETDYIAKIVARMISRSNV